MKFSFIEVKYKDIFVVPDNVIEKLPQTVALFVTIQFIDSLEPIKKQVEDSGRTVKLMKGKHTKHLGQIYGCNLEKFEGVDAFFYVGDGYFHPKALVLGNDQPVHMYNPVIKKYEVLTKELMQDEIKRQKGAYLKFMYAKEIGVLISIKSGQSYYEYAKKLEKKYIDKNFYFIVFDTIDFTLLEDFSFVEVFVNTACPRIGWDDTKRVTKPMVDLGSVLADK